MKSNKTTYNININEFVKLCHLLLLNLYSLISVKYVLKAANDLCTNNLLISTLDECKSAVSYLKDQWYTKDMGLCIVFFGKESSVFYPKGCYKDQKTKHAFWNTHQSGSANENAEPICKASE